MLRSVISLRTTVVHMTTPPEQAWARLGPGGGKSLVRGRQCEKLGSVTVPQYSLFLRLKMEHTKLPKQYKVGTDEVRSIFHAQ